MDHYFDSFAALDSLSAAASGELDASGFTIIPGPFSLAEMGRSRIGYDAAVAAADHVRIGSTTNRVNDFVNCAPEFDPLYIFPPILEACFRTIRRPFKLSNIIARTVRPDVPAQEIHVDFAREGEGWPMIGFIFMVDEFRPDNGATQFWLGSHGWTSIPDRETNDPDGAVAACGPAGSIIIYNGSVWHGHGANSTSEPRRSIQGAFIRRDAESSADLPARLLPETLARFGPLAKYLVGI